MKNFDIEPPTGLTGKFKPSLHTSILVVSSWVLCSAEYSL